MSLSRHHLAKIHIARQQLCLDDETYRSLLARIAGVSSAKQLTKRQVSAVLAEFERLGWQPKPANRAGRKPPRPPVTRAAVMSKVEALLAEASRPWAYADGMAKHMFHIERVDWLDDAQLQRLMTALIYDAKRNGRPTDG